MSTLTIRPAEFPQDLKSIATLFADYAFSLKVDISFQNFDHELLSLPGQYSPSNGGALILASISTPVGHPDEGISIPKIEIIGCVCLRALKPEICELKRLYIKPEHRNLGAGRKLMESVIAQARQLGYKEMLLDTLPSMEAARKMYRAFGFEEVAKYYDNPIEGTSFMRLQLK